METPKTPPENSERPKIHHPEYIILEATEEPEPQHGEGQSEEEYFRALHRLEGQHFSMGLRILMLFLACITFLLTLIITAVTLISATVTLVTFFQYAPAKAHLTKTWSGFKKCLAITLGLFVAVFSPPFGLGMIMLYFLLQGEGMNQSYLGRIFEQRMFHGN